MTIRGIYNADGTTTYTTADTKNIFAKAFNGKVIFGQNALVVSSKSTPDMSVNISSGDCSINGAILQNTTTYNLAIEANSATYTRIDCVVAYISGTTYSLRILKGTASANPTAPSTTSNFYVKLAEVTVGAGVTSIQSTAIRDCRENIFGSLSEEVAAIKTIVDDLDSKVNAPAQITTLASFPYTPSTLVAVPNGIYRIEGITKAEVRGMDLSKLKDGDKIYFFKDTDASGTLTLTNVPGNFELAVATFNCIQYRVHCMMMINGVMRLMD